MDPEQDLQLGDSKRKREIEKEKGNLKKDREGQKIMDAEQNLLPDESKFNSLFQ